MKAMRARTFGMVLIIVALVVAFTGQSRQETDATARQRPSGHTVPR
jgi:hypothetical protein